MKLCAKLAAQMSLCDYDNTFAPPARVPPLAMGRAVAFTGGPGSRGLKLLYNVNHFRFLIQLQLSVLQENRIP